MKPDHIHLNQPGKKNNWLPYILAGFFLLGILLIFRGFPDEKRFTVVQLKGKGSVTNWSKSFHFTFFPASIREKGAILTEKNDLLGFNDTYFRYQPTKEDTLRMSDEGDSLVFLNGKINSLVIHKNEDLLPWFKQMKPEQLTELTSLLIQGPMPESYIPYLKTIASQHSQLSLTFADNDSLNLATDYIRKAGFFQPTAVFIPVTNADIPELVYWKQAKCIFIVLTDSIILNSLPVLPEMKECIVYGDDLKTMPADFFINNPQLKKLSLLFNKPFYELLTPLNQLDELVLNHGDSVAALDKLKNISEKLSVLLISGKCTGIEQLVKVNELNWLGLPDNTSQKEFNLLTNSLKKLQVLEIAGNTNLTDFSSLQELPDLRGLVFIDTVTDKKTISQLKKLRYLSLPEDTKEDSAYIKEMRKALPGCIVVANSGACLGSGWLLLLLPVALLAGLIAHKKTASKNETPH